MIPPAARLRSWLESWRQGPVRRRAAQELRRSLALIVDPEALQASVANRLKEIFDPDRLAIFQLDRRAGRYRLIYGSGFGELLADAPEFLAQGRLARWLVVNESCLVLPHDRGVLDSLDSAERELLGRLEVQLCAPLLARHQLEGMVLLGRSRPGRRPGRRDAELLSVLADQVSLAFHNAALYRERQERLERLHRANRLAAIGQLAAGVAHEVRNPLTAIRSTMQYLGQSFDGEDPKRELVLELLDEVDRIDRTIQDLLGLTRSKEFHPEEIDLVELIEHTANLLEAQARRQEVEIELSFDRPVLEIAADADQLRQVFLNVMVNALQAMPNGGHVGVHVAAEGSERVRARIVDDGPGISPDRLQAVFDPFFTTKSEGTGLGLSICHSLVERHGGEMELESTLGEGTTVSITLPYQSAGVFPLSGEGASLTEESCDGEDPDRR